MAAWAAWRSLMSASPGRSRCLAGGSLRRWSGRWGRRRGNCLHTEQPSPAPLSFRPSWDLPPNSPCSSTSASCSRGSPSGRGTLMVISMLSIVYGALRCNILAIKIKYDDYEVDVRPAAYLCIFMWRSFEIASRVVVLVLFSSVLQLWILPVVLLNFLVFFLYPWILFWKSHSPFPENIEKTLTRVGTTIVLCLLTFLYAGINMFCWSAVRVKLSDPDLINKSQNWYRMALYYMLRFVENASLLLLWYVYKTDFYNFICAPLLLLQLLVAYAVGIFFMLVFYQFCHPCRRLFSSSMTQSLWNCSSLLCLVCTSPSPRRRPLGKSVLDPLSPGTHKEPGTEGPQDTASDSAEDIPNDTTYDMLDDTVYDTPNEMTNSTQGGINGDISHGASCNA
nr:membrane transport protein XK [Labrus bergylta]